MDIILQGEHSGDEAAQSLERVLQLFKERYHIAGFREIHLTVTLIDEQGDDVELVDSESNQAYRIFEVYRQGYELSGKRHTPVLQLVVDNTK
jgi:hypothetical protein